ncbi:MAG: hypothetical protein HY289_04525 [Planctomycetes bacterium]|nr:hypothetical protein [Planctomycetota bacterium]
MTEAMGFSLYEGYAPLDGDRIWLVKPVGKVGQFFPREGIKTACGSRDHVERLDDGYRSLRRPVSP